MVDCANGDAPKALGFAALAAGCPNGDAFMPLVASCPNGDGIDGIVPFVEDCPNGEDIDAGAEAPANGYALPDTDPKGDV